MKRRIGNEENIQTERVVAEVLVEETNSSYEERNQDQAVLLQNQPGIQGLVRNVKRVRAEWEDVRMSERTTLPKIALTRKAKVLVRQANQAIHLVIEEKTPSLSHINLLEYVTAYMISEKR